MAASPRFHLISDTGKPRVNVFIHGYGSTSAAKDIHDLARPLRQTRLPGKTLLLTWDSGKWDEQILKTAERWMGKPYAGVTFRGILGNLFFGVAELFMDQVEAFHLAEEQAENLGLDFPQLLRQGVPDLEEQDIHLIGHSLGARVIHYALLARGWGSIHVQKVLLLAGAADRDEASWERALKRIKGDLHNYYSPSDILLRLPPDLRRRIGSAPLLPGHPRLVNLEVDRLSQHAVWPILKELIQPFESLKAPYEGRTS